MILYPYNPTETAMKMTMGVEEVVVVAYWKKTKTKN
jgi:hypothetical protein